MTQTMLFIYSHKQKTIRKDRDDHYIMIKKSMQQKAIMTINLYALNVEAPSFIKQTLLYTKERDKLQYNSSVWFQYLNVINGHIFQIKKKKNQWRNLRLNYTIDRMDLTDSYRTVYWTASEYVFFAPVHRTLEQTIY